MENEPTKIKLWSPETIGVTAFFLGFPGGALLSTINAQRMGDMPNKKKYVLNGVLYVFAFAFFRLSFQDSVLTSLVGIANIFLAYWLYHDMKDEIEENTAGQDVIYMTWWKGALIALGTLIVITLFYLLFMTVLKALSSQ